MREVREKISGGPISEQLLVRGQITDSASVKSGGILELRGQLIGDLVIDPGGEAIIKGMVLGNVINRGSLKVSGEISKELRDESGNSEIDAQARIGSLSKGGK